MGPCLRRLYEEAANLRNYSVFNQPSINFANLFIHSIIHSFLLSFILTFNGSLIHTVIMGSTQFVGS